ncbi:MAG: aminotransferase class I/II-fold pyridoxal phosphate-dependent enzyme, partial [Gemmatimonadetes bacterium]|nr:aminotransferase class I/II-fold pyridoxal phosphate-dependent enzyme [Gemmatimonadota bacterium]
MSTCTIYGSLWRRRLIEDVRERLFTPSPDGPRGVRYGAEVELLALDAATAVPVPVTATGEHDLAAMAAAVTPRTRVVLVCTPNNPTGPAVSHAELVAFAERVPRDVLVVVDEAYLEFVRGDDPVDGRALLRGRPNVVLLRTFSKVYGLAGLRVGYGLCGSEELVHAIDQVRQPFFCNVAAQAAAVEALRHQDAVAQRVERTVMARVEVEEGLRTLGLDPAESQANFAWFDLASDPEEAAGYEPDVVV